MSFISKVKGILQKLQGLSLTTRKIILWVIVAIMAIVLIWFWIKLGEARLEKFDEGINNFQSKVGDSLNKETKEVMDAIKK